MVTKWLVTGGCGFLGRGLIRYLISEPGNSIRVLDNLSVGRLQDLGTICDFEITSLDATSDNATFGWPMEERKCQVLKGDIRNEKDVLTAVKGAENVVHLAANTGVGPSVENPRKDLIQNILGTFNLLDASRINNVKKFIFASSGASIGSCQPPIHENKVPHPVSPYGASKLSGEAYCSAYWQSFQLETVGLRFGNVYGPHSEHKDSVVAKALRRASENEIFNVYGDGEQSRDFIYVEDLIRAIIMATITPNIGGEIFQIASGNETTINELLGILNDILIKKNRPKLNIIHANIRQGDVRKNFFDITKARQILKWQPRVDLESGLTKTVEWFLEKA